MLYLVRNSPVDRDREIIYARRNDGVEVCFDYNCVRESKREQFINIKYYK